MKTFWARAKAEARRIKREQGLDALYNPHALIGRECKCKDCFCCAAWAVYCESRIKSRYNDSKEM